MYKSLEEICEMTTKEGKPFWKIVQEDDCREQGISEGEAFEQMRGMYQAMREADDNYDGKLKSASGLVGTDGEKMHAAREAGTLLCGKFIGKVMEKALKTGESNACMKRIVAAPTAGSCGVVPAVFLTLEEEKHFSEEKMVEALYTSYYIYKHALLATETSNAVQKTRGRQKPKLLRGHRLWRARQRPRADHARSERHDEPNTIPENGTRRWHRPICRN